MKTTRALWRDLLRQVRLVPFFALLAAAPVQAQSPNLINYQGRLTDAQGNPVTGNRTMVVKVYDAPNGGNVTYQENIGTVAVTNGTYSFQFGDEGDGIIAVLIGFSDYLSLTVNGTEEATRTRLLAVPYSLKSADAQALAGKVESVSGNVTTIQSQTASLTSNVTALQGQSSGLSTNFGTLNATVGALGSNVTALQVQSVVLSSNVTALQGQSTGLSTNFGTLNATVGALGSNLTALQVQTSALGSNVTALQSQNSGLSSNLGTLNATVGALGSNVTALQGQSVVLSSNVTALQGQSTGLSANFGTLNATVGVLGSNVTALQVQTSALGSNVTALQSQNSGLSSNLGTLNATVGALSSNVTALNLLTASITQNVSLVELSLIDLSKKIEELSLSVPKTIPAFPNFVSVRSGSLPQGNNFAGQKVATFYIGKTEVTWSEWQTVRAWAVSNGYTDLANIGSGSTGNHSVSDISWYDAVKWCNAKSEMEGLTPVYSYNGTILKVGDWQILGAGASDNIVANNFANGYRLPTAVEWIYAAAGGASGGNLTYSGSNDINAVAWYASNSGNSTQVVATKLPNQLGIYDMNGNAMEWCWDRVGIGRIAFGGTWNSSSEECKIANFSTQNWLPQVKNFFDNRGDFGLRLARSY